MFGSGDNQRDVPPAGPMSSKPRRGPAKRAVIATWDVLCAAFEAWIEDRAPTMGAAIAFYTTFSLAPILLLVIAIAGLIFGERAAQGALFDSLRDILGPEGARALEAMIAHAYLAQAGPIATALGAAALLVTSTGVLTELQAALNIIWKVTGRPGINVWHWGRRRLLCLAIILVGGALLTAALAASAVIHALTGFLVEHRLVTPLMLEAINLSVTLVMTVILFAMIFKILPDANVNWRDVWLGAAITAILFMIGRHFIGLYIGSKQVVSIYGAAGALAIILIWVYYSTQILLFGAEITKAYADRVRGRAATAR
jgi:membrane protein